MEVYYKVPQVELISSQNDHVSLNTTDWVAEVRSEKRVGLAEREKTLISSCTLTQELH